LRDARVAGRRAARGVNVALPHGDPACDGRVRVRPITTAVAAAPLALQFPRGPTGAVAERVGA